MSHILTGLSAAFQKHAMKRYIHILNLSLLLQSHFHKRLVIKSGHLIMHLQKKFLSKNCFKFLSIYPSILLFILSICIIPSNQSLWFLSELVGLVQDSLLWIYCGRKWIGKIILERRLLKRGREYCPQQTYLYVLTIFIQQSLLKNIYFASSPACTWNTSWGNDVIK